MKLLVILGKSLLIPFALLLLVHFFIKDRSYDLAMIFNAFPMPVLIGLGLFISMLLIPERTWFRSTLIVTLLLAAHWLFSYYGFHRVEIDKDNNHILLWNIDNRKFLPREELKEQIDLFEPDIMAFLETRKLSMTELKYLKEQFPQYQFNIVQGYFLIATKDNIELIDYQKFEITKFHTFKASIVGKNKTLMIADVGVKGGYFNQWQDIEKIHAEALKNKVDMVFGDFNTPYESYHFNDFKKDYQSFHDVSEGFTATWPKGLPLLELDQIWVDEDIEPITLKKFYFKDYSNHDMLIGSFNFND
ncbi:MAG: endonuclease/exonuclease/phosphatase family protein [Flavobacteriaceae bacterium]|nr:endonuclease/exonuclease/phosphatase family protein [Flavobacteriaceae bacterium]